MPIDDPIALSFFPLRIQLFNFAIYRRKYEQGETREEFPGYIRHKLPVDLSNSNDNYQDRIWTDYWISFEPMKDFEAATCPSDVNNYLTFDYLFRLLKQKCEAELDANDYRIANRFRDRYVSFVIERFPEGEQEVSLEPYYLKSESSLGFLTDFKFKSRGDVPFSRKIQQLSLSLDDKGRSNKNFYADRYEQIQCFIRLYRARIFQLQEHVEIETTFLNLPSHTLETKQYVFADQRANTSQFKGVKQHGPLHSVNRTKVYFLYPQDSKPFADDLFRALRGDTFTNNFPGMKAMFRFPFDASNVGGTALAGFGVTDIERAITHIKADAGSRPAVPVVIVPFNRFDEENDTYYKVKHTFLRHHMPSQFVSLRLMRQKNQLKWAIANIGLQLFAKMGGQPWRVQPKTERCLIIGIGQSHKIVNRYVEKYFAYSVLTESTGLYKELRILGQTTEAGTYYASFKRNLRQVIQKYYADYDSFVVHTTFKIRGEDLAAIREVITELKRKESIEKHFVLMKFNDKNKYFGYAPQNNSMIPYESSYIRLSSDEFLVWFEGLQYHNRNVFKKVERPIHIEFLTRDQHLSSTAKTDYLQDALNISGANWRGFNAKSLPISVHYAYLVAQYYKEFQALGLEEINFETISPWFL